MRVEFESTQMVEVCGPKDTYQETEFVIGLTCTNSSSPANYNPSNGGWPSEAAEFELATITVNVPVVKSGLQPQQWDKALVLTWNQFCAFVGLEAADVMVDAARDDAQESGEF